MRECVVRLAIQDRSARERLAPLRIVARSRHDYAVWQHWRRDLEASHNPPHLELIDIFSVISCA